MYGWILKLGSGSRDCSRLQRLGVVAVGRCSFRNAGVPVKAVQYDGIRLYDSGCGAASKYTVAILYSNIRVRESNHNTNYMVPAVLNLEVG